MTFEERINELEDTVIRISYVLELKKGAYSHDGNPAIRDEGQHIERWARAIQERRAGTEPAYGAVRRRIRRRSALEV